MTQICVHCYVSGHVQGVFYRREAREKALSLGLKGWVKNLADGRVELKICGDKTAIDTMVDWLWEGPEAAKVSSVQVESCPLENLTSFEVK